ncbi:TPM domain-containing protein [Castellaniella caeni]|uniref:TPM domain-containing protein n=1 Tax=Castellaniella TaxID=359336 RepID=UPI0008346F3C|nr:TPM domain-containing protein [Castellaniella caeni]
MVGALLLASSLVWSALAIAQVPVPPLTGHVIDQTKTLDTEQKATLEQALTDFEARKGTQIAVLIVASTAPEQIEQFSLRVAEQWKPGRAKVDDGAILVVAKDDRTVRIEVGYGLEGALTDLTSGRIISELILPRFRQQDFYGGIAAGVGQIIRTVDGEALPAPEDRGPAPQGDIQRYGPVLFIVALALGGLLRSTIGRVPGAVVTGGVVGAVAWLMVGALSIALFSAIAALLFTLMGGGRALHGLGGLYRGGRGHRGGGFRGGGGGFGGGGASGRW